jgi:Zn-dependent peptidase ImmA (M78 family)
VTAVSDEQAIIQRFQNSLPVDVTSLAEALGIKVWESSTMPDDVSGKIMRDEKHGGGAKYSILVNSKHPYLRKRFTVAHEIAHYILHREQIGYALTDDALYRSGLSGREEAQANRLAAEILMPQKLINEHRVFSDNIERLAKLYQVSQEAMRIRLRMPGFMPAWE